MAKKQRKRCSASINRKMETKTTMRYYSDLTYCRWEYRMVQPQQKTLWQFFKNLKMSYDPAAIPLLGLEPKELKAHLREICPHPCSQ